MAAPGLVVTVVLALLLFGSVGGGEDLGNEATGGELTSIQTGAGEPVTRAQFESVQPDTRKQVVEQRFGAPTTTENPLQGPTPEALQEDCIGYDRAGRPGELLFFCFTDGRLTSKQEF